MTVNAYCMGLVNQHSLLQPLLPLKAGLADARNNCASLVQQCLQLAGMLIADT